MPEVARAAPAPKAPAAKPTAPKARTPSPATAVMQPAHRASIPAPVASAISTSLGVDLSAVRVHSDADAVAAAGALGARAFTVGNDIVLGGGERASDLGLMAHEVAHVVQQNGAQRIQLWSGLGGDRYEREAQRAASAVVHGEPFTVRERTTPHVQRLGISDALDYFADKAYLIPGYRMLTIIIGVNPINMSRADRSAANILRAIVEFIPGGALITQALDKYGVFERAGAWIEQQISTLGLSGAMFKQALDKFLDSLSWRDIFHLGDVWDRAKRIFTDPIGRVISFVVGLGAGILRLIRDAILKPLAKLAEGTRGYDLLKAVLGQDPITGEPVPRDADTLIGGFMKLIGQEEVWANIKKANAISRAWQWFQGALQGLLGFVRAIPKMFISALHELEIADIVLLPRAFAKVGRAFLGFIGNFISWALSQVLSLLQIIFEVLAPAVMPYLRKAMGAFQQIIRNPIGFVGNLVRAGVQGLRQFMGNFLSHLRKSLIGWLTGTLEGAGIYIPQAFELKEIVKFVLSVLGLTWANIRTKLLKHIPEPVLKALETGFDIVVTLVREGPAAAWEKIKEQLSNLKDMVMEQVMNFVRDSIVTAAITKLVTSLNPAGAFIQAIIAIYNTIMFFVERLRQIAQVAAAVIDSISAIASGAIGAAAKKVEDTLGGLLTLVISFLARLVGLGKVSDAVKNIVARIRAPIDKALDHVVEWIVATARRLGRFVAQAGTPQDPNERLRLASQAAVAAARRLTGPVSQGLLQPLLAAIRTRYGLRELTPYEQNQTWWVRAEVNPIIVTNLGVSSSARVPEGPVYGPIIGKLTQAIQMFTVWAGRGTSPVAQQMLRQLEMAREEAQTLGEAQSRGVFASQLEPRRQALIGRLRGVQNLDPRYALVSIAELSVTLQTAKRQMPPVALPPWTVLDPALRPEYVRQLREQQDGINAMTADQWERNRARYVTSGRSAAGARQQATFQRRMGRPPATAAPHNPDQAPGGFQDPTGMPAALDVNNHIGSQWPSRLPTIAAAVNALASPERLVTQMNVQLRV